MKKLKKVLSLALVLAMVLTLVPAAFAVDKYEDYTDKDQITQVEAVQVLTGMGIINGMDTGAFKPTGSLTRAEAAKIVAYMQLGEDLAEALAPASPFKDVPATNWASKYVAYCTEKGIIAGYEDKTFRPNNTLTADQFLKMLLVAVGYDAKFEKLEGTNQWATNTRLLAVQSGMVKTADLKLPFNRETACYYALKALLFKGTTDYTYSYTNAAGETVTKTKKLGDVGKTVYDLVKTPDYDDLKQPINTYTYNSGNEKTVVAQTPVADLSNKMLRDTDVKGALDKDLDTEVYEDGVKVTPADNKAIAALGGMGTSVKVYVTKNADDEDVNRVVVINTYVGIVKEDPKPDDEDAKVAYGTEELMVPAEGLKKDDVVSFNLVNDTVKKAVNATKLTGVEGSITAVGAKNAYIIVDGARVDMSKKADTSVIKAMKAAIYKDSFGNALYLKEIDPVVTVPDGYVYVLKESIKQDADRFGNLGEMSVAVSVVYMDGTSKTDTMEISIAKSTDPTKEGYYRLNKDGLIPEDATALVASDDATDKNELCGYYKMEDGTYVLEEAVAADAKGVVKSVTSLTAEKGQRTVKDDGTAISVLADNNTKMTVLSMDGGKYNTKVCTGYNDFMNVGGAADDAVTPTTAIYVVVGEGPNAKLTDIFAVTAAPIPGPTPAKNYAVYIDFVEQNYTDKTYTYQINSMDETVVVNAESAVTAKGTIVEIKDAAGGKKELVAATTNAKDKVTVDKVKKVETYAFDTDGNTVTFDGKTYKLAEDVKVCDLRMDTKAPLKDETINYLTVKNDKGEDVVAVISIVPATPAD